MGTAGQLPAPLTPEARYRGALLGLAAGDAVGTTLEFRAPGSFIPITDMVGGGPFGLAPGEWTDDTSMALCLAESLVECGGHDPRDQMERYVRWWREGHLSSNGRCFDIGNTVSAALGTFERTADPYAGSDDPRSAGNGSLMRLAPVALALAHDPRQAIDLAGDMSRTTHGARTCVDACRYFAGLLVGALGGVPVETLLSPRWSPVPGLWDEAPLDPAIDAIAGGSFVDRQPPQIRGTGHVVAALEAALWAVSGASTYREACLRAVNLGDDADTTGAIAGQLAGALWGVGGDAGIPQEWVERLALRSEIEWFALRLLELSRGEGARGNAIHHRRQPPPGLQSLAERGLLPPAVAATARRLGLASTAAVDHAGRFRGALLGGAIGDALGRPHEGSRPPSVLELDGLRHYRRWPGWTSGPIGTVTDDTQMTMCVAESLIARGGLDPGDLAERFVAWLPVGRGKGRACVSSVECLTHGEPWYAAGVDSAGNGAAMRVAPIGLLHLDSPDELRRDAALSAVITHASQTAVVSAVAHAFCVAYCVHRAPGALDPRDLLACLAEVLDDLPEEPQRERPLDRSGRIHLRDRLAEVGSMLDADSQEAFDHFHNGAFVLESLPAALWCFLRHRESPETAILTAVSGGYDADTVASLTGNLVGAYHGDAAFPRPWLDQLEYADDLRRLGDGILRLRDRTRTRAPGAPTP